jgi:predicted MFS family arabinose efflux permease
MGLQTGALWQFYFFWLVLPVLGLGLWPASWVRASAAWFTQRLGFAIGVVNLGIGLGAAALPIIVSEIAERWGWRTSYIALGVSALLITWPIAWRWVHEPHAVSGSTRSDTSWEGDRFREARQQRVFWALALAFVLLGFLSGAVLVNHVNILVERGIARETAISLQALLGAAMVVARIGTGWLLDRVHVTIVMPVFAAGAALGFALYAGGATGGLAVLCAVLMGLVVGAELDVLGYAVRRYHGRRAFGSLYGLLFAAFALGSAIGTAGIGFLHSRNGSYDAGLIILALVSLAAALILTRLGRYRFT